MRLTEPQRRHVEDHRETYRRKYSRWIRRRYALSRQEAHDAIDMGMCKAGVHWAEGRDIGPLVFLRARTEALKLRLLRLPLTVSVYERRILRVGLEQPPVFAIDAGDGAHGGEQAAVDDLDWLAHAAATLTKRQRRSLHSRKQNSAIHRQAITILRGKAAELLRA